MLNSFLSLSNNFRDNKIEIENKNLNELITKYEFLYIQTISDFEHNQKIWQNIKESKVVIISQNKMQNQSSTDKYFIISFQRTILLINLSSLSILHLLFNTNPDLNFYYLSDTQEFIANFPKGSFFDDIFLDEIQSFNKELYFNNNQKETILAWSIIQPCISGYLIKQCYSKMRKNRIRDFSSFSQTNEKISLNEDKFIELRLLGLSNGSRVNLFYYIDKEEFVVIKNTNLIDDETKKLKKREIENYLKINHPFLPKFYGIVTKEKNIVIEFINGPNLFSIKEMNLTDDEKFTIIFEIMITIQFLHQNNFIVRDLKPNNVMIDEFKNAILIDFDRMLDMNEDHSEFSNQFWSPFIAPEVNSGSFSYECDIYSIGLMIYYIMLEQIPKIKNLDECLEFKGYSKLYKIFKNCSSKDPKNRKPLSKLIFSFFINYYSKIKIENLFAKFEDYFLNIYENYELDILKKITLNNNSEALFSIGLLYLEGKRFSYNINKAIKYFTLSADQNNEKAQIYLGQLFEKDHKDIDKAIKYYTFAANQGNEDSMYKLGYIFEHDIGDINKAIEYYTFAANKKHIKAQFNLGCIYEEGRGIQEDIFKAIYYFTFAANQKDIQSLNRLGQIFLLGKKIKPDLEKSIYYLTLASNLNDENAHFLLGHIYENVINPHDYKKAIEYYTLSANKNNISAIYNLGLIYEEGEKAQKDIYKAIHYYSLAAKLNDKKSQYKLGYIYQNTIKPPNINKAIEYYTSSADQNYCLAQVKLGNIYYSGYYFKKDIRRATHYYILAAKQNDPEAQFHLGLIYEFYLNYMKEALYFYQCSANQNYKLAKLKLGALYMLGNGVPKDANKASQYIASSNLLGSFYNYNYEQGNMYFKGENCVKNIEKAIHFYQIASDQNFNDATIELAYIYLNGTYVPRDMGKAIYYFKLAADNDSLIAKYNLGAIYSKGINVPIDVEKGMFYYNSVNKGQLYPLAQYNLGCIYFYGKGKIEKDIKKAIDYFSNSAKYNFPESQYNLGSIYYHGEFIEKNIKKAIYYYDLAARQNFPNAQLALGFIYYNDFNENQKFIQKGIYWLNLAAKNRCLKSYFFVGYIYHEGQYVKSDIHKAIHFYKEASNFNSHYAKNNLGVIYKNGFGNEIEKNIFFATEYFKEAIKLKDSAASIFNLASLYFYEDPIQNSIDESIKLLIQGALKDNIESIMLLCLAMVKKFATDFKSMENELIKYFGKSSPFPFYICTKIKNNRYYIKSVYKKKYQEYKTFDLLYNNKGLIHLFEFYSLKKYKEESKAIDITSDFYEGFGL